MIDISKTILCHRVSSPAGCVQETSRSLCGVQPLLRQEEQAQRQEKTLQLGALPSNVGVLNVFVCVALTSIPIIYAPC